MATKSRHSANVRRVSVLSARRGVSSTASGRSSSSKPDDHQADAHVKVAVRCRPMSDKEMSAGYESIVEFESDQRIVVHDVSEQPSDQLGTKSGERRNVSHVYDFDQVFDWNSTQQDVYDKVCRPIVDSVLEGFNGTIFAYGQTGTGKTYTMEGPKQLYHKKTNGRKSSRQEPPPKADSTSETESKRKRSNHESDESTIERASKEQAGIIPRTFEQIFDHVQSNTECQFLIRASYLEVYQEEIRDLLRKDKTNKLELHERPDIGVYVKDLTSFVCKSISEIERVMRVGNQNRIVAATDMNEHSSRSHAIFMITIEQQQQKHLDTKLQQSVIDGNQQGRQVGLTNGAADQDGPLPAIRVGKLNLVDLAGSERQRKTNSFGQRQKESIKINLSLSALGNVINSLMKLQQREQQQQQQQVADDGSSSAAPPTTNNAFIHTPYRDSKLTRLLQDSFGGNAKTLMIANIGPASYNYDETINTLNYASRARCIRNRPRLNEDPKDALLRELQREIELLRAKLADQSQKSGGRGGSMQISDNQSSGVSSAKSSSRASSGAITKAGMTRPVSKQSVNTLNENESIINNDDDDTTNEQILVERKFFELKQKLSSLESKLLNSGKFNQMALQSSSSTNRELDHQSILKGLTREQELELERRQKELANQVDRERAIRDELERREEAELMAKQSFESIQQEIEAKRKLIWQVLLKVKSIRDDIASMQQAYRIELDELEQLQFVLQRELKLKCLIMDNFICNDHVDQLLSRVNYDEYHNLCTIRPLELPTLNDDQNDCCILATTKEANTNNGNLIDYLRHSTENALRPRSELERLSETINPSNIRYKYDDLIEPKLVFINLGDIVRGSMKQLAPFGQQADGLKPRRLCDILGERMGFADVSLKERECKSTDLDGQLQSMINDALSHHEPDIVI
jgi:hypothetical protein